ncbi:MAG TPA: NADH-quinone oxidoreductase subunit J [Gemmatimonadales bacterium]|jgi:NADH-quinone oxidoreductase subunit J
MMAFVFWQFAALAIVAALLCITRKNPVASALWLVVTLFAIAGLFVLLDAHFLAALQVLVYAGAIMVLFLFVIMLLNLGRERATDIIGWGGRVATLAVAGLLVTQLWMVRGAAPPPELTLPTGALADATRTLGAVAMISEPLFRDYLLPFELTSLLLLAAIVGAVVLAKRKV